MNNQLHLPKLKLKDESSILIPGSKSITNRVLLIASLSKENCIISNILNSDDTIYMQKALDSLGFNLKKLDNTNIFIEGNNNLFNNQQKDFFLGNAGTAVRFLVAILALSTGEYHIDGIPRMRERPIKDLVDALISIGANIEYLEKVGYLPLKIKCYKYNGNSIINLKGNISSQFLSALLIALPNLRKKITINIINELISKPYVEITLKILKKFNINIEHIEYKKFLINDKNEYLSPKKYYVESDASSASYFLAASFITGKKLILHGIDKNSIQGDIKFAFILEKLGAIIHWKNNYLEISRENDKKISNFNIDAIEIPDAAMTFAIIALIANGTSTIYNISSWKVKETDRILAIQNELQKLGASVTSTNNSISITPPTKLNENIIINTYDDHRIAMCFSLISLMNTSIIIDNYSCVNKTYPNYFDDFRKITFTK